MPSISSKLFNLYINLLGYKKKSLKRWANPPRNPKAMLPPSSLFAKLDVQEQLVQNRKVITITPDNAVNKHILYFHGGAYADEITLWHWKFVANLVKRTNSKVSVVEYPLTPEHTYEDTFAMVRASYELLTKGSKQEIILMGDSAGGGLGLALAQFIIGQNITPKPSKLVLISPWLDIEMSEPIPKELRRKDLILSLEAVKLAGRNYLGDGDPKHFIPSPIYGNFQGLPEVGLWYGTSEIFYPDMARIISKMEEASIPYQTTEGKDMQHIYPLFPTKEGIEAMKAIVDFIN